MNANAAQLIDYDTLLDEQDGSALEIINPYGKSPVVLVCEHAANRVPAKLQNLGLTQDQLASHIGWDPGARELALQLSRTFDAPLIAARFSRLVYDCNRPPEAPSAMPFETEQGIIPGNQDLTQTDRDARAAEIYEPFHQALEDVIEFKRQSGEVPIVITVHSFTPVFNGQQRAVQIGYLHGTNDELSKALEYHSSFGSKYDVRLNQPYAPVDGVLHTIEKHLANGAFPYVMIEVRNDLLTDENSFADILSLFSTSIPKAVSGLDDTTSIQTAGS